ncbi:MAG: 4-alpha-glucanotransferase [Phycisphaerae bacterium]|nr:4-alpha-glucanotransferase [Phycisphaerae bacterium]
MPHQNAPNFRLDQRAAGVLLHPTSLPGPHGSGDLGPEAYAFIDFLADARVRWWQMLPHNPIGPGNSPYASASAFAGSPLMIDLKRLAEDGLLERGDLAGLQGAPGKVRFGPTIRHRHDRLRKAFAAFQSGGGTKKAEYRRFCEESGAWLEDFALFTACHERSGYSPWSTWEAPLRDRHADALHAAREELAQEIEYQRFLQYEFHRQWHLLRKHAHHRGVGLIGDVPIFVAHDSADVWQHRELFTLDDRGRPTALTGCPPDHFNADGQLWGHPQFEWAAHERTGFAWWVDRFRSLLRLFDAARIDHFLGFHRVWWLAGNAKHARNGHWAPSPGDALFGATRQALGNVNIIAEDLGATTPEAFALRDKYGFPGMRIMSCGFGSDHPGAHYHLPHMYTPPCVAFTGTHDNETTVGWYQRVRQEHRAKRRAPGGEPSEYQRVERYFAKSDEPMVWRMIRSLYGSAANLIVIPMQDLLELPARARMNIPGTPEGNWEWRMPPGSLKPAMARKLAEFAAAYLRG